MLNWKLEAKAKSTMAFELLKFIKSKIENEEVFGYILLVIKILILKKLADLEINHKFRGGLLGIKRFYKVILLMDLVLLFEDLCCY
ncbi:hypothetical protein Tco_0435090 [Tanacetum coccineum]